MGNSPKGQDHQGAGGQEGDPTPSPCLTLLSAQVVFQCTFSASDMQSKWAFKGEVGMEIKIIASYLP